MDLGCMGGGRAQWWAVNVTEGREVRYCELLLRQALKTGAAVQTMEEGDEALDWRDGGAGGLPEGMIGGEDDAVRGWVPSKIAQVRRRRGVPPGRGAPPLAHSGCGAAGAPGRGAPPPAHSGCGAAARRQAARAGAGPAPAKAHAAAPPPAGLERAPSRCTTPPTTSWPAERCCTPRASPTCAACSTMRPSARSCRWA
jgi:hypothetical protein